MPELSSFYGIRIFMRFEQGSRHHKPHFHVLLWRPRSGILARWDVPRRETPTQAG